MYFTDSPYERMMKQIPKGGPIPGEGPPPLPEGHPCHGCCYAANGPCIGYCLKELMKKERSK